MEDYVLENFDKKCGLQKTPPCPCGDNKQNFVSADLIERLSLEVTLAPCTLSSLWWQTIADLRCFTHSRCIWTFVLELACGGKSWFSKLPPFQKDFRKNAAPRLEVRPSKKTSEIKAVLSRFPLIWADSMKVNLGFQENSSCITQRKIIVGQTHTWETSFV